MYELNYNTETRNVVDYHELERKIQDHYGVKEFSIPCDQETGNDCSLDFSISKGELDDYATKELEKFKETGRHHNLLSELLTDMANNDIIPEGDWLIYICW